MNYMFDGCSSLIKLDLSNFRTFKVKEMEGMFKRCSSLKNLNISNFDVSSLLKMDEMFSDCSSLVDLDLSNFIIHHTVQMNYLFSGCSSLKELNISNFSGLNIRNSICMFYGCSSLINLNIPILCIEGENMLEKIFLGCNEELKLNIKKHITYGKEKEELNYEDMKSLGSLEEQKEYLGNILWEKISKNSIIIDNNIDFDIVSQICEIIVGFEDIDEIFDITANQHKMEYWIEEALFLLGIQLRII